MGDDRKGKQITEARLDGRRTRERPRNTYMDVVDQIEKPRWNDWIGASRHSERVEKTYWGCPNALRYKGWRKKKTIWFDRDPPSLKMIVQLKIIVQFFLGLCYLYLPSCCTSFEGVTKSGYPLSAMLTTLSRKFVTLLYFLFHFP